VSHSGQIKMIFSAGRIFWHVPAAVIFWVIIMGIVKNIAIVPISYFLIDSSSLRFRPFQTDKSYARLSADHTTNLPLRGSWL
jgi:hypothetical protein